MLIRRLCLRSLLYFIFKEKTYTHKHTTTTLHLITLEKKSTRNFCSDVVCLENAATTSSLVSSSHPHHRLYTSEFELLFKKKLLFFYYKIFDRFSSRPIFIRPIFAFPKFSCNSSSILSVFLNLYELRNTSYLTDECKSNVSEVKSSF